MTCICFIRNSQKLNSKKEKSNSKCAKDINRHFIEEGIQMANGHMKRCLTSLGKCKLKLQWAHLSEWLKLKSSDSIKCWWEYRETGLFVHCWWECKIVQPLWTSRVPYYSMVVLKKLSVHLPYNPAIILLGIYPREMKMHMRAKTCTQLFAAALFVIAPSWKQPKYL